MPGGASRCARPPGPPSRDKRQRARQQGQQASSTAQSAGRPAEQERQEMQNAWKQEVSAGLDRALSETSRLTERQLASCPRNCGRTTPVPCRRCGANRGRSGRRAEAQGPDTRRRPARTRWYSPQIGVALGMAQQQMRRAQDAISNATPAACSTAESAGQAVDALNAASYQMARAASRCRGAGRGRGLRRRWHGCSRWPAAGALSQEGASLLPMAGRGAVSQQLRAAGRPAAGWRSSWNECGHGDSCRGRANWRIRRGSWRSRWSGPAGPADGGPAGAALSPDAGCRPDPSG